MIGSRLAHYEIVRHLGAGGMGEVYVAQDTKLQREVALKVLPEDLATDADRLARFEREATTVAALNHPNIVTIYSVEEASGIRFMTMELVRGQTLDALIPEGGMSVRDFLDLAVPLADAIAAAHAKGVQHRDLKIVADGARTAAPQLVGTAAPVCVLLNPKDIAYGQFLLDPESQGWLIENIEKVGDPLIRAVAMSALGSERPVTTASGPLTNFARVSSWR